MILKATELSKSYRNGNRLLPVLEKVSLEISNGDLITIMGESGAGKSTLLNILGTLDCADSGTLIINNKNILDLSNNKISELRNKELGFVFQFHHLLPDFTAFENVLVPNQISGRLGNEKKAAELLNYIGLNDRFDHLPSQLSGGERLRVSVVRALMNDPQLILADEPTGNLDAGNAVKLIDLFKKINLDFKLAFIITTHNPKVAQIGEKKLLLEEGKLSILDNI